MSSNLPTLQQANAIDYRSNDTIRTLKATVAYGLSEPEFMLFVEHCKSTKLNPFKKEVWAIKAGGRLQLMTGNAGFHQIANSHVQYDGIETGFVGKNGEYLPMTYPASDFIGAWAKVYRKDRRIPLEAVAMLSEYDKAQGNWKTMKRIMIVKCAESLALRKAFPQELNGLYTQEEMPVEYSYRAPSDTREIEIQENPSFVSNDNEFQNQIDWQQFKYRYHLPHKKQGTDMEKVRSWLKEHHFKFNPDDKHWYGNELVEKISQYLRPLEEQKNVIENENLEQSTEVSYEDDLPTWLLDGKD